jgi:hypothetical protein
MTSTASSTPCSLTPGAPSRIRARTAQRCANLDRDQDGVHGRHSIDGLVAQVLGQILKEEKECSQ